jgi:DNA-directed RNA polymerase subunit RPC12/RpoP
VLIKQESGSMKKIKWKDINIQYSFMCKQCGKKVYFNLIKTKIIDCDGCSTRYEITLDK